MRPCAPSAASPCVAPCWRPVWWTASVSWSSRSLPDLRRLPRCGSRDGEQSHLRRPAATAGVRAQGAGRATGRHRVRLTVAEMTAGMHLPEVVSPEEWLAARKDLLVKEKEATRAREWASPARRRRRRGGTHEPLDRADG